MAKRPDENQEGPAASASAKKDDVSFVADAAQSVSASQKSGELTRERLESAYKQKYFSGQRWCTVKNMNHLEGRWASEALEISLFPPCTEVLKRLTGGNVAAETIQGTIAFKSSPGTASNDIVRPQHEDLDGIVTFFEESAACDWVHFCELH